MKYFLYIYNCTLTVHNNNFHAYGILQLKNFPQNSIDIELCELLVNFRNETELFVVRWMDLESVIQSEISQKEKNKYRMLTHIYGI